jgi:CheY-like chemotaxis protein
MRRESLRSIYLGDLVEEAGDWRRTLALETEAKLAPSRENECCTSGDRGNPANGHEGLKRAEEERPDLVITDLMRPVMDGTQFIKAMAEHPGPQGRPDFLMSSAPEAALRDKCSG